MTRFLFLMMLVALLPTLNGCASRASYVYRPGDAVVSDIKTLPVKVAVIAFEDKRPDDNTNAVLTYLIPLFPFGTMSYDRPDGANGFLFHASYNFRPSEDLAKSVVDELKQNRFFEEVFFTQRTNEPNVDLIVSGKIDEARYDGKMFSYCLSLYGPNLWILGLPAGTTHNALDVKMEMKRASDNVVVWSHEVKGEWNTTVGLYYNWAADFDGYPILMREGLRKGMEKLASDIRNNNIDYWKGKTK